VPVKRTAIIIPMGNTTTKTIDEQAVQQFITFWSKVKGSELATAQSFVSGLCALLNMPPPMPAPTLIRLGWC
jgi:hypothetical protein